MEDGGSGGGGAAVPHVGTLHTGRLKKQIRVEKTQCEPWSHVTKRLQP